MLLALTLLSAAQAAEPSATNRRECAGVIVTSPQQAQRKSPASFSATQILDLQLQTLLVRRPTGPRTLELKLYTPRGHLYQVLTVPFSATSEGEGPRKRQVDGFPQPLLEQTVQEVTHQGKTRYSVRALLPVAGTTITLNSLYGEWTAEPHLDGGSEPCGPAGRFVIDQ